MTTPQQLAKHLRELHTGNNVAGVNLRDALAGVTLRQAIEKVHGLNSIAMLVFHVNYYVNVVLKVMQGKPLDAHDKYSFGLGPLETEEAWQQLVNKAFSEAEQLAGLIEQMSETQLQEDFASGKYGNNFRNLLGQVEHTYYHLGQISLIKKMVQQP
ncbi:DinB family protein [Chitinophaga sp. GCM10012297]|uniref:DinB-like domain-containing protein n=1 Tax=Chitinophaga chungangae TaxID=2821488 RepID=A0ABS3YBU3_9BACT|nr:DinB family protein [Chitinophaga chungangae]MBO9152143.1 hypothetical protein [Chitinophaga chungangae]